MSETTVRSKSSESTSKGSSLKPSADKTTAQAAEGKLSPTLYADENNRPYLAKHYSVEETYKELPDAVKDASENIQDYFEDLHKSGQYENDKVGFKDFMKKLERQTDTKSAPLTVKIKKIAEFIKYLQRTKDE